MAHDDEREQPVTVAESSGAAPRSRSTGTSKSGGSKKTGTSRRGR